MTQSVFHASIFRTLICGAAVLASVTFAIPVRAQDTGADQAAAAVAANGTARIIVQFRVDDPETQTRAAERALASPRTATAEARRRAAIAVQRVAVTAGRDRLQAGQGARRLSLQRTFDALPYAVAEVDAATLEALRANEEVSGIFLDRAVAAADENSEMLKAIAAAADAATPQVATATINADDVWATGYTGQGQTVAVLDTGVDASHPMFANKIVAEACYSSTYSSTHSTMCPSGADSQTGSGAGTYCPNNGTDPCSHGSHVAGIAVGNDPSSIYGKGVAPGANLISVQIFTRIADEDDCTPEGQTAKVQVCLLSYTSDQLAGLNFVINRAQTYNIAAVNLSLGGDPVTGACDNNPLKGAIDTLRGLGIATAIAAGNDKKVGQMSTPACISTAVSVGAVGTTSPASFTNVSELTDLMAPGVNVRSAAVGGGYVNASGTSMSTPHVAGAFALLKSVKPTATVAALESALKTTGPATTISGASYTVPRLDLAAAASSLSTATAVTTAATTIANVRPVVTNGAASYIRIYNPTTSPGTVTITVRNGATGANIGTWQSASIPARAVPQYDLATILSGIGATSAAGHFALGISSNFTGYVQHLSWNQATGTLGNVSGCDQGVVTLLTDVPGLYGTPTASVQSTLVIANTGTSSASAIFDVYRASDGGSLGAWQTASIPPGGEARYAFANIISALAGASSSETLYVARLRSGFDGFAQHLAGPSGAENANLSAFCNLKAE
ncbi:MAG: S8 family serine peptidase [Rhodobacteraceae bacterium]|nr:S8 family serine peptidase [Paracoccaceae bacterium]